MTTSKDKQIRELKDELLEEQSRISSFTWFIAGLILGVLILAIIVNYVDTTDEWELKQQLKSCQEKIPVWTLKYNCDFGNFGFTSKSERVYQNYDRYKKDLDYFKSSLECEVLE